MEGSASQGYRSTYWPVPPNKPIQPTTQTRNRKPLKRPVVFMATWEIRFGPQNRYRVYYDVDLEQTGVSILAIGSKHGNRVTIGAEEIRL